MRSNLLTATTVVVLFAYAAVARAEPIFFTSRATIYRGESTTGAFSVFATNPYTDRMTSAACDTDGNLISVDNGGQVVRTRLTGESEIIAVVGAGLKDVTCFGNTLYAASIEATGTIKTIRTTGEIATLATLPQVILGLAYSRNGDLYANTGDSLYRVTSTGSVSFVRNWTGYPLRDLAWLPSGDFLACGSSGIVSISQDPGIAVISPQPYDGRNGIGSSLFPYALSLDQAGTPAYLQNFSPFNTGSWLMYQGNSLTGGAGTVYDTVAFQLAAVPEPSTWAMAIAGGMFLRLMTLKRRRGRSVSSVALPTALPAA